MDVLRRFGAPLHQIEPRDFETPGTVFQIGVAPRRVDILTSIDAVDFEAAWPAREEGGRQGEGAGDQQTPLVAEQKGYGSAQKPRRRRVAG